MNNTKNVIIVLIIIIILLVNILLMFPKKKVYEHLGLNDAILDYGIDMPDAAEALGIDDIRIYIPSIGSRFNCCISFTIRLAVSFVTIVIYKNI